MSAPADSLVRVRRLLFDRSVAGIARAVAGIKEAQESLEVKLQCQASIERRRMEISSQLEVVHDARWLAQFWAFDRLLGQDLLQAREEVNLAEVSLSCQRESLSSGKKELARARAKLSAAQSLGRQRKKAARRQRERRMGDVSGIRTRCL